MTISTSRQTSAFWMPKDLPTHSQFRGEPTIGPSGDVAGPQKQPEQAEEPAPKPQTGWSQEALND